MDQKQVLHLQQLHCSRHPPTQRPHNTNATTTTFCCCYNSLFHVTAAVLLTTTCTATTSLYRTLFCFNNKKFNNENAAAHPVNVHLV
jgi:hypothetical protein